MLKINLNDETDELTVIKNDGGKWIPETSHEGWSHTIVGYNECAFIIATQRLQTGETSVVVLLSRVDDHIKSETRVCNWADVSDTINYTIESLWKMK